MNAHTARLDSVLIEGNRLELERRLGVPTEFNYFRDSAIVFARSLLSNFPGSKPNCNEAPTAGLRSGALAQRPLEAAIPATGAGQLSHYPSARAQVSRISMPAAQSGAVYDGGQLSTEEAA